MSQYQKLLDKPELENDKENNDNIINEYYHEVLSMIRKKTEPCTSISLRNFGNNYAIIAQRLVQKLENDGYFTRVERIEDVEEFNGINWNIFYHVLFITKK